MGLPALVERYDALFIDLDGVVYRGDQVVPAAPDALEAARGAGCRILFLTNNSSRTQEQVVDMLSGFGIRAEPSEILTSAGATAAMLRRQGANSASAFVIGERGLKEALLSAGVKVEDGEPEWTDLVVVGWDRSVDFRKLRRASLLVQRGSKLIATNGDPSYPAPDGLWPGTGAILSAITTATGAQAVVVGKPARPLFESAAELTRPSRPLVVGDRLDTDIPGASTMDWDSLLVLTGASRLEDLGRSDAIPTYLGVDLSAIERPLPPARFRPATVGDLPGIRELLVDAGLASFDIEERLGSTLVSRDEGGGEAESAVTATACLEAGEGAWGVLRSVAVRRDVRHMGLGALAIAACIQRARALGIRQLFLQTVRVEAFFERLGFERLDPARLPVVVKGAAQAGCPASATWMGRDLGKQRLGEAAPGTAPG